MQDRARMRIKSDDRGDGAEGTRSLYNRAHDQLMAQVQPIKNTKGQYGRPLDVSVVGAVEEAHKRLPIADFQFVRSPTHHQVSY